ncbi:ABC transporter permease [Microbacterium enclense]|uniref:Nucleoside ABC transporter membrane protein n=1 Tax=Microbacterium enclense TaxID=993073 RepID=A0A1G6H0J5_9MICO|nr:ABC transporter permease [Microbacterium enclense]SDB87769.1 nucleoside ABC transporter membrane protein [Microbacterium enclense]
MSDPHSPHDPNVSRADRAAEVADATSADIALEGGSRVAPAAGARVVPSAPAPDEDRWRRALREIATGNAIISVLAVVLALLVGAIMIAATDENVQAASGYFFARPGDTFAAIWQSVSGAYASFFQGAIYNFRRPEFATGIRPLTETLTFATPLIAAGLGVALAFRVGMFNIGGRGQMLVAAAAGGYVAFAFDLPWGLHMVVALVAGVVAGALWAGIAGLLKARTGAHEVIVTIMLNYVGFYLVYYLLRTPGLLQAPGSSNPTTPAMKDTAVFPDLFGPAYNLHFGFILSLAAVALVWWILERSSLGFRFRAVGLNPNAARVAGINVKSMYVVAMLISGGLIGLAGVDQVLGTVTTGFSSGIDAGIGFDAITVALLGRSTPVGVLVAGILFGAFKAGGFSMQAANGVPIDIVLVVQSLIVLFIAAPPLVRAIFRLPAPGVRPVKARTLKKKEAAK